MHQHVFTVFAGLMVSSLLCSAQAAFVIRSRVIGRTNYIYLTDLAKYYGMKVQRSDRDLHLTGSGRKLELKLRDKRGKINGYTIELGFAVIENRNTLLVSEMDLIYVIDPIFRDWGLIRQQIGRIIIDPGHGGKDSGALGRKSQEKDIVLNVAYYLKQILEPMGYKVVLTRTTDRSLSLASRPARAGDLFVSLHCNKSSSSDASGIETWYCTPRGMPSTYKNSVSTTTVKGNKHDRLNTRFAYEVQRYLLHYSKAKDRGPRRYRWKVLSDARCPAVLVEMGFLSNSAEETKLVNLRYQQQLALGLASGIISFHRVTAPYKN